jgi:hypothetical protein
MVFRTDSKIYTGPSAAGIVAEIERDNLEYPFKGKPLRCFVSWSLKRLGDHIPQREIDVSSRISDETLALSYLYLREEYGLGALVPDRGDAGEIDE